MLNFSINLEFGTITNLGTKFTQISHNSLKLGSRSPEVIYEGTKISLLIRFQPVTD